MSNEEEINSILNAETSEEVDKALGLTPLEKKIENKLKDKQNKENFVYRFNYVDLNNKICINTIVSDGASPGERIPSFVKWDGEKHELCKEFKTPNGLLVRVPPINEPYYRSFYDKIVFPNTIIEDIVPSTVIDDKITVFLKTWHVHPDDYFIIARNYIKFTWLYERFFLRPYLLIYGDYGTGKTEWGSYIVSLCQNGFATDDISAPALARILEMTGSTVMLDEIDKIDYRTDAEKMNTILRNGYREGGEYIVAEQEGKIHKPTSFRIDQPKILVKRKMIRDDALSSRSIPFKLTPRDSELKDEMRRNDESWWHKQRREEIQGITNLLLKWRWQNIFLKEDVLIVPGITARFNDTLMPLLKMGSLEDRGIMINFMRKQEKVAIDTASDDLRIQTVKFLHSIASEQDQTIFNTPSGRISLTEILDKAKEELSSDMSEFEFKKIWNPRYIKRNLMDLGFEVEIYRHKSYIKPESIIDLLPRLCEKYNIKIDKDPAVDNSQDIPIDNDNDKSKLDNKEELF